LSLPGYPAILRVEKGLPMPAILVFAISAIACRNFFLCYMRAMARTAG